MLKIRSATIASKTSPNRRPADVASTSRIDSGAGARASRRAELSSWPRANPRREDDRVTAKERILFQPYIAGRHAGVVPGQAVLCRSADDAHRRAEKAMAGGQVVGVHIVRVLDDAATG